MIIDVHCHTFPRLGGRCGDDPPKVQLLGLQHHTYFHPQGWRRKSDGQLLDKQVLFDGVNPGISGMNDVNFRVGEYGRLEITYNGEDYWMQWMPPTLQQMECPPEMIVTYMDYVGVDKAVLQNIHLYGELNAYSSECIHRYPGRFIGLAAIREWKADQPDEIDRLTQAVEKLDLRGLHFMSEALFMSDYKDDWTGPKFEPLWKEVQRLRIPIFWDILSVPWGARPQYQWQEEARRLTEWARRHPDIPCLLTHGLPVVFWTHDQHHVEIPEFYWDLLRCPNMYIEVILPIMLGSEYRYPYTLACELLKEVHQKLGPHKLIWGSDMPALERSATYKQSLDYLDGCDFLTKEEYGLMVGGNAAQLLNL